MSQSEDKKPVEEKPKKPVKAEPKKPVGRPPSEPGIKYKIYESPERQPNPLRFVCVKCGLDIEMSAPVVYASFLCGYCSRPMTRKPGGKR